MRELNGEGTGYGRQRDRQTELECQDAAKPYISSANMCRVLSWARTLGGKKRRTHSPHS